MAAASLFAAMASAETFRLNSPDGKIEALVSDGKTLTLDVSADGKKLLEKVEFAMEHLTGARSGRTPQPYPATIPTTGAQ